MHTDDHLYIVAYDISDQKRWRRVFRIMQGRGAWLQLSVFQCRLSRQGLASLRAALHEAISHDADHVVVLDLGPADQVTPRVTCLGKAFTAVSRQPIIV
jgi:CRISPR-associated protein Cas2